MSDGDVPWGETLQVNCALSGPIVMVGGFGDREKPGGRNRGTGETGGRTGSLPGALGIGESGRQSSKTNNLRGLQRIRWETGGTDGKFTWRFGDR